MYCILNYFVLCQLKSTPKVDMVHLASYLYSTIKVKNCIPTSIMLPLIFNYYTLLGLQNMGIVYESPNDSGNN